MFDIWRRVAAWLGSAGVSVAGLTGTVPWPVATLLLLAGVGYLVVDRVLGHLEYMATIAKTADGAPLESAAPVVRALRAPPPPERRRVMGAVRRRPRGRARGSPPGPP